MYEVSWIYENWRDVKKAIISEVSLVALLGNTNAIVLYINEVKQ